MEIILIGFGSLNLPNTRQGAMFGSFTWIIKAEVTQQKTYDKVTLNTNLS